MGGTDGWVYPNNWDHKKGCMMQHEPGREPTETKWEKVSGVNAGISWALSFAVSGQRPMPGSEVSRAEVLRMSTDTLLKAEAERLPDTPAPDEVAQLRAEVLRVTHAYEQVCMGIQKLRDAADLSTARVAELEAELEAVKADKISVWAALLATGKVIEEELMRLAGPEPSAEMVGGPTHTTPGKEPTSE